MTDMVIPLVISCHGFAYQEAIDVWFCDQLLAVLGGDAATVLDSDLRMVRQADWADAASC